MTESMWLQWQLGTAITLIVFCFYWLNKLSRNKPSMENTIMLGGLASTSLSLLLVTIAALLGNIIGFKLDNIVFYGVTNTACTIGIAIAVWLHVLRSKELADALFAGVATYICYLIFRGSLVVDETLVFRVNHSEGPLIPLADIDPLIRRNAIVFYIAPFMALFFIPITLTLSTAWLAQVLCRKEDKNGKT